MKQILVDKDRYEALEALYAVLRYQFEMNDEHPLRSVVDMVFELSKNSSVLGPPRDLIKRYEHLAETELMFRIALAEIANGMDGGISASSVHAREVLDKAFQNR